ncbi:aminotransferase class I and II [Bizionia argentinensis JUB59]|uniref:Aminotransferase class I and II n=1 Tax=Bizionia argentinensis JUB59 TaxID=1046627 RepID=G2EG60_9FLAO|nr:HipA family kinase [Bizionia argentinensis]EGV42558.1 aminotransferase class I and II [Bizionia argentinensis JUB59]
MNKIDIRHVEVVQYISPLREGGSLPAIVKADDDFLYVLKFRGAGQGKKALIAEFIGGEIARTIGLHVPELVFMNLDDSFSKTEPDEEIQDLLKFSVGLNLGLHYLSSAITFDPLASDIDSMTASKILLMDSIISNIDRTAKNTNLLVWNKEVWVIDNGASFYFHHNWQTWENHLTRTFPLIKDHVLLEFAKNLKEAAIIITDKLTDQKIQEIISLIPEDWLENESDPFSPDEIRAAYITYLQAKLSMIDKLVKEAEDAR